jgi:hypothetical protein
MYLRWRTVYMPADFTVNIPGAVGVHGMTNIWTAGIHF